LNHSPEMMYRRFLLGIASEEEECRVEEAVLAGEVDKFFLLNAEDELIDDYLFGILTPEERDGFSANFLSTEERRQRLVFANGLIECARRQQAGELSVGPNVADRRRTPTAFSWMQATRLAAAASVLFAALAGFEQMQLHRQAQIASDATNELTKLQAKLSAGDSGSSRLGGPSIPTPTGPQDGADGRQVLELLPPTRDVIATPSLHIPRQAHFARFDVKLALPVAVKYREVIVQVQSGEQLWAQEFPASNAPASQQPTIVVPAAILPPGPYHFQIEVVSADGRFELSEDHVFQVIRE
jgi:hypothetical protein